MSETARAPRGRGTILLLAAIAALGSLATQLVVPALPRLAGDFAAGVSDTQLVVSLFLIGLGAGQLLAGPLSDRLGRKPVLLAGLAAYCAGSALAAVAPSLPALLAARVLQALGGAAGIVGARVLVADLFPPEQASARQATLMSVVLVSPAAGPVIGGALVDLVGWRVLFGLLALLGLGGALLVWRGVPGGRPARIEGGRPGLGGALGKLRRNRRFLAATATIAAGSSALYMYLGAAPFLLTHQFHLPAREVGLCLMTVALASIGGTFLVARLDRRGHALLAGAVLIATGGVLLVLAPLAGFEGLIAFLLPTMVVGLGAGISGPAGIVRITRSQRGLEGTAASLAGAFQMLSSALCSWLLSHFAPVDPLRLGLAVSLLAIVGVAGAAASHRHEKSPVQGLA